MILFCKLDGGGVASGGLRELIPCIARTSVAVGVDGIFMEVDEAIMLLCSFYLAFFL
jgi:3-deoxy-D-manno-octulosonic acid (KDO) 8-phosphate synthase